VTPYTAAYAGLGLEDFVTFEADDAAQGFQDAKATAALNLLRSVMIGEEAILLGGNASTAFGTTPTPTLAAGATGGTIGASITVSVIAVALTLDGLSRSTLAAGLPTAAIARTNTDGSSDSFGGGVAQKSAAATGRSPRARRTASPPSSRRSPVRSRTRGTPARPAPSASSRSPRSTRA
jgi:hypothetical protein